MIVCGVDPGARATGVVVIDTAIQAAPMLLDHDTVLRPKAEPLLDVSPAYLHRLQAVVAALISEHEAAALAIEGLSKPRGFKNGRRDPVDPQGVIAAGIVLGALLGRTWGIPGTGHQVDVVVVPPGRNGSQALAGYPGPIATRPGGRGQDARRHERSAYDVARQARGWLQLAAQRGAAYV